MTLVGWICAHRVSGTRMAVMPTLSLSSLSRGLRRPVHRCNPALGMTGATDKETAAFRRFSLLSSVLRTRLVCFHTRPQAIGGVPGDRALSKKSRRGSKARTRPTSREPHACPSAKTAQVPGVVQDYLFTAPKVTLIRLVACAAAAQVCLASGFAPAFWFKMGFLDEISRGIFIAALLALSSGTCYAAARMQGRYVSAVSKSVLSKRIAISTPSFLSSRVVDLDPKHIRLVRENSIRDLLGRPHTAAERASRAKVPLSQLAVFTIEVSGKRMLLDTEGLTLQQREELLQVLGVISRQDVSRRATRGVEQESRRGAGV